MDKLFHFKRWPVVRHVRYYYLRYKVYEAARWWYMFGIGMGQPNPADLKHLEAIRKGEA